MATRTSTRIIDERPADLKPGGPRYQLRGFAWQTGYGAFSVSQSNAASVVKYIREQEEHHRRVTFQEEFVSFLKKNGVRYDERYIWE